MAGSAAVAEEEPRRKNNVSRTSFPWGSLDRYVQGFGSKRVSSILQICVREIGSEFRETCEICLRSSLHYISLIVCL